MLDSPPRESETRSWLYVLVGTLVIYCTIPIARSLRELIREQIGLAYFLYIAVALIFLASYLAFRNIRRRNLPLNAQICLFAIFVAFLSYVYALRAIPEEAVHITEYGALGLLVFRAFAHRMRDISIYFAAALVVGMIGTLDEYIQWLIPSRVFDLRDIRTNFIAGALTQAAIAVGLRPQLIQGFPSMKNWSRICYISVTVFALLAIGFMNTPQRIAWYSVKVPFLAYLMDSKSMMVEYGHRFDDPEIGVFRSRFSLEELKQLDQSRGDIVGRALDKYIRGEGYPAFQSIYTVIRDPHTHEAGVHLFRREYYFDQAPKHPDKQAEHYLVASRENQILVKYFSNAIKQSKHFWERDIETEISKKSAENISYESKVSKGLITRLSETQVMTFFATIIIGLMLLGRYFARISRLR